MGGNRKYQIFFQFAGECQRKYIYWFAPSDEPVSGDLLVKDILEKQGKIFGIDFGQEHVPSYELFYLEFAILQMVHITRADLMQINYWIALQYGDIAAKRYLESKQQ